MSRHDTPTVRLKNVRTGQKVYFRWWSDYAKTKHEYFYYTPTTDSEGFMISHIQEYEPVGTTWDKLKK